MQDNRSIRLSQEDWSSLLLTAVKNGYPNRTEYIRAMLKGTDVPRDLSLREDKPWRSAEPPAEIQHFSPVMVQTTEPVIQVVERVVEVPDPNIERKLAEANAKIAHLQAALNSGKKLPIHRFSLSSIVKRWPEARQARYAKLGSPPDEWIKAALETVYDMLDEYAT